MCNTANTPALRPHPSRKTQWAFPGGEAFHPDKTTHEGIGHYPYPDEWLTEVDTDTIIAFFGFNESFDGLDKLNQFKTGLSAWVSTVPSYPHYKPGEKGPNDKILLLEDTDGDNRTDKQTVFADKLHIPIGFELASGATSTSRKSPT